MQLSASSLKNISSATVFTPAEKLLQLPEKILQFGTGILLRGLPDYFIDKANRQNIFNGRIVVIKSTSKGNTDAFEQQDCLYTLCVRGIANKSKIEENSINSSISRVLQATDQWQQVLECAHNKNISVIISNTTEVGIEHSNDDITSQPPPSFPGKLLAVLYERFTAFNGDKESGFVIVPTELIPANADILKETLFELAKQNNLPEAFFKWLEQANYFCNSLVDRIVTGMPAGEIKNAIEKDLGYTDELLNVCEVFRLWAIEGDNTVKEKLLFSEADEGIVIEPDIEGYRELKLRLLNGTHTLSCGIGFLAGLNTVSNAMEDTAMSEFITSLMKKEIGPSIPYNMDEQPVAAYIENVLDRFRNPYINHQWKNITLNYSSKMKLRCIPLLLNFYKKYNSIPRLFALGFAAYLVFMKAVKQEKNNQFFGLHNDEFYLIEDNMVVTFYTLWNNNPVEELVKAVIKNKNLWGVDISALSGFQQTVTANVHSIIDTGMKATLDKYITGN